MRKKNCIQWKHLSAEGAAIVLSILLAFSIDAWCSDRERKQDEQVLLSILQVALANQRDTFSETIASAVAMRNSVRKLLNSSLSSGVAANDQELDKLISDLTWVLSNPLTQELTFERDVFAISAWSVVVRSTSNSNWMADARPYCCKLPPCDAMQTSARRTIELEH